MKLVTSKEYRAWQSLDIAGEANPERGPHNPGFGAQSQGDQARMHRLCTA